MAVLALLRPVAKQPVVALDVGATPTAFVFFLVTDPSATARRVAGAALPVPAFFRPVAEDAIAALCMTGAAAASIGGFVA
jgi:hypothetical protein